MPSTLPSFARRALCALLLVALAACGSSRRDRDRGGDDDGCDEPCGAACCGAGETCDAPSTTCVACTPKTCGDAGAQCGSIADGCGGTLSCGSCAQGSACEENQCVVGGCTPHTCADFGANCGSIPDGCGGTLSCGSCSGGQTCHAGGPFVCGTGACVAENDLSMCRRLGKTCGSVVDFDNCGNSRSIASCGACADPQECRANVCTCTGESDGTLCADQELCGRRTVTDRCGRSRTVECEPCRSPSGSECTDDSECAKGLCIEGLPGGYCSGVCSSSMPCDQGASCVQVASNYSACLKSCASSSECRVGYKCAQGVCQPDPPDVALYEACGASVGECTGTAACVRRSASTTSGVCLDRCNAGTCAAGFTCLSGVCAKACAAQDDCPGDTTCADGLCGPP